MKQPKIKRINPNEGQAEALSLMKKFIKDKKVHEFCLNGVGGTGKTTVIKELFLKEDKSKQLYIPRSVIGVTVSHKARLVLQEHIPNSITYAAAVNMTIDYDQWGEMIFVPKSGDFRNSKIYGYKYIIFDEASMVSDEMRTILNNSCSAGAKIIYLGDNHQLPPIKPRSGGYLPDKDSSVFDLPDNYTLTEKMRQNEGDYIAHLCDVTCEHIDGDNSLSFIKDIRQEYDGRSKKGVSLTTEEKVIKSFVKNFKDGANVRITAYRNARINYLNDIIRKEIFGADAEHEFTVGELIVGNDQYAPVDLDFPVYFNGEDMIVERVEEEYVEDIGCWRLWCKNKDKPIYVVKDDNFHQYNAKIAALKADALSTKFWGDYMAFKKLYANVSYGYAVSLYKIQGTTLRGVYVDVHDILGVKPLTDKRKLQSIYVGFSRPTHFLGIF